MDPARFDQLSRFVGRRCSRRRVARGVVAAVAAGAVAVARHDPTAADCNDTLLYCGGPHHDGGHMGHAQSGCFCRCWYCNAFRCELCPGSVAAAAQLCNDRYPAECGGQCIAF